jgi:hypothetical protein
MAFTTQEQLKALLQMQDIGLQEEEQARMQALSDQLRSPATGQGARNRMDWASQAARGLQGIQSAYSGYKAQQNSAKASEERSRILALLAEGQGASPSANYATMPGAKYP